MTKVTTVVVGVMLLAVACGGSAKNISPKHVLVVSAVFVVTSDCASWPGTTVQAQVRDPSNKLIGAGTMNITQTSSAVLVVCKGSLKIADVPEVALYQVTLEPGPAATGPPAPEQTFSLAQMKRSHWHANLTVG